MQNYMKTILSAIKLWTKSKLEEIQTSIQRKIEESVADWNQNDPSLPDYVKNRPFYKDKENGKVFEKTVFITPGTKYYDEYHDVEVPIVYNKEYIISVNGVESIVESYYDDTDSQYCVFTETESAYVSVYERYLYIGGKWDDNMEDTLPLSEKYEIIVYDTEKTYKCLDSNYLPSSIVRSDIFQNFTDEEKAQVRSNIDAVTDLDLQSNCVWYGVARDMDRFDTACTVNYSGVSIRLSAGTILIITNSFIIGTDISYTSEPFEIRVGGKYTEVKTILGEAISIYQMKRYIRDLFDMGISKQLVFMHDGTYWRLLTHGICSTIDELTSGTSILSFPTVQVLRQVYDKIPVVPSSLPSPHSLTINGMSYDGSEEVNITINTPDSGSGADFSNYYTKSEIDVIMGNYINDIDTLLGGDA